MKVTEEHEDRARELASGGGWAAGPPVFRGYLAAVERIDDSAQGPGRAGIGREEKNHRGVVWSDDDHVFFSVENRSGEIVDGGWTPEEARLRAYELLVLADDAEGTI